MQTNKAIKAVTLFISVFLLLSCLVLALSAEDGIEKDKTDAKNSLIAYWSESQYKEDAEMLRVIEEYNKNQGIFDSCQTEEQLAFEVKRAFLRLDLCFEYASAIAGIEKYTLDPLPKKEAYDIYDFADYKICQVSINTFLAYEVCKDEYQKASVSLYRLLADTETEAYLPRHSEILNKAIENITVSDKEALVLAMSDMQRLSEGAKKVFEARSLPYSLVKKYKAALKLEIYELFKSRNGVRMSLVSEIAELLDCIEFSGSADGLEAFIREADRYLTRADLAEETVKVYEQITSSELYPLYTGEDKTLLIDRLHGGTSALLRSDFDLAELEKIKNESILSLEKADASALIDVKTYYTVGIDRYAEEELQAIAFSAKEKISSCENKEDIDVLLAETFISVSREIAASSVRQARENAFLQIEALDTVTADEKKIFESRAVLLAEEALQKIKSAKTEEELDAVAEEFSKKAEEIISESANEDIRELLLLKERAKEEVSDIHYDTVKELGTLPFIDDSAKIILSQAADRALEDCLNKIDSAIAPSGITEATDAAKKTLAWVGSEGKRQDGEGYILLRDRLYLELYSMADLGEDEKKEFFFCTEAQRADLSQKVLDLSESFLNDCQYKTSKKELNGLSNEYKEKILSLKKESLSLYLKEFAENEREELAEFVNSSRLSKGKKQELIEKINTELDGILSKIDQTTSLDEISSLAFEIQEKHTELKAFLLQEAEKESKTKTAVWIAAGILSALAIAVAAVLIWKKKK